MESLVSQSGYIATHANAFAVWHGIGERHYNGEIANEYMKAVYHRVGRLYM